MRQDAAKGAAAKQAAVHDKHLAAVGAGINGRWQQVGGVNQPTQTAAAGRCWLQITQDPRRGADHMDTRVAIQPGVGFAAKIAHHLLIHRVKRLPRLAQRRLAERRAAGAGIKPKVGVVADPAQLGINDGYGVGVNVGNVERLVNAFGQRRSDQWGGFGRPFGQPPIRHCQPHIVPFGWFGEPQLVKGVLGGRNGRFRHHNLTGTRRRRLRHRQRGGSGGRNGRFSPFHHRFLNHPRPTHRRRRHRRWSHYPLPASRQ